MQPVSVSRDSTADAVQHPEEVEAGTVTPAWPKRLPMLLDELAADWRLELGQTITASDSTLVVQVSMRPNREAVLKLRDTSRESMNSELDMLLAARGHGYAELYAYSSVRGAMLLERLAEPLGDSGLPVKRQIELLCASLKTAWSFRSREIRLMDGAAKAQSLVSGIREDWRELNKPCALYVVNKAEQYAELRARSHDARTAVVTHGDAHPWNALRVPGTEASPKYKLIDPHGLFAEPAYDLGLQLREWTFDLLGGDPVTRGWRRCRRIAQLMDVDAKAIWQWGLVQLVASGLLGLKSNDPEARSRLRIATAWARAGGPAS